MQHAPREQFKLKVTCAADSGLFSVYPYSFGFCLYLHLQVKFLPLQRKALLQPVSNPHGGALKCSG